MYFCIGTKLAYKEDKCTTQRRESVCYRVPSKRPGRQTPEGQFCLLSPVNLGNLDLRAVEIPHPFGSPVADGTWIVVAGLVILGRNTGHETGPERSAEPLGVARRGSV